MKKRPKISPLTLVHRSEPFDHPDWIVEMKHVGFWTLAYISDDLSHLLLRRNNGFKKQTR